MSRQQRAQGATTATAPSPLAVDGPAGRLTPAFGDDAETVAPAECVGPVAIPTDLTRRLRSLGAAAGAEDLLPWWICASVLVRRLSGTQDCRARVICGADEAVTARSTEPLDMAVDFRTVLRRAVQSPPTSAPESATCPVEVTILVSNDRNSLYVETMSNSADTPLAQCWARSVLQLLAGMVDRPDAPIDAYQLVDEAERDRILHRLNPYRVPEIGYSTLAGPFEEQVERTPDAVAVVTENGDTVSYRQLNGRANRLAHYLRDHGAGTGTRIGICLERGIHQIVAIYAAVKTGAAYVPLDAELPDARLAYLLENSAPRHMLTDAACRGRMPEGAWRVHDVDADDASWDACPSTNPVVDGTPDALLHLLYTSGTTGHPKGVASATAAALANIFWMQRQYPYLEGDSAVFKTSPGFDVSIWEVFWPLYHGARLVICRPGGHRDPRHLAKLVEEHSVSMIFLVPTMMTPLLEKVSRDRAGGLRWVVSGGESMAPWVRDAFHATLPTTTLVNAFGPTEAGPVTDNVISRGSGGSVVPVGRPAPNFRITLVDENLGLVPVGMAGEAYISGEIGLAHGYWRAPARTAERFVADPYGPPGSRMYRTGDVCRYRENGLLEHLGRIDRQVKIRGQRIELGEIESVVAGQPAVGDCAVIAHGDPVRLLAFVVPAGQLTVTDVDPAAVLEHVATLLPDYMRPDRVVPVAHIPATVNGKTDEDELIRVWQGVVDRERDVVPPADELEATLVEIYGRVLNVSPVSVQDTFVQLGGHSLLAFQLLDECEAHLYAKPEVTALLTDSLRDVAASIRSAQTRGRV